MPSFIFNSKKLDSRAGVLLLAAALALVSGVAELAGSLAVPRISRIQKRIAAAYKSNDHSTSHCTSLRYNAGRGFNVVAFVRSAPTVSCGVANAPPLEA